MRQPAGQGCCWLGFIQTPNFSHHIACQTLRQLGSSRELDETQIKCQKSSVVLCIPRIYYVLILPDVGEKIVYLLAITFN